MSVPATDTLRQSGRSDAISSMANEESPASPTSKVRIQSQNSMFNVDTATEHKPETTQKSQQGSVASVGSGGSVTQAHISMPMRPQQFSSSTLLMTPNISSIMAKAHQFIGNDTFLTLGSSNSPNITRSMSQPPPPPMLSSPLLSAFASSAMIGSESMFASHMPPAPPNLPSEHATSGTALMLRSSPRFSPLASHPTPFLQPLDFSTSSLSFKASPRLTPLTTANALTAQATRNGQSLLNSRTMQQSPMSLYRRDKMQEVDASGNMSDDMHNVFSSLEGGNDGSNNSSSSEEPIQKRVRAGNDGNSNGSSPLSHTNVHDDEDDDRSHDSNSTTSPRRTGGTHMPNQFGNHAQRRSHATAEEIANGQSCHQCKSRRACVDLSYCTSSLGKKNKNAHCRKKYCEHCLRKFYREQPAVSNENWSCPSCRNICTCAACTRRKTNDNVTSRVDKSVKIEKGQSNDLMTSTAIQSFEDINIDLRNFIRQEIERHISGLAIKLRDTISAEIKVQLSSASLYSANINDQMQLPHSNLDEHSECSDDGTSKVSRAGRRSNKRKL